MRVCAYRNPDAASRHRVDCGGALDESDPAPFLVTKQHTGVNASWAVSYTHLTLPTILLV